MSLKPTIGRHVDCGRHAPVAAAAAVAIATFGSPWFVRAAPSATTQSSAVGSAQVTSIAVSPNYRHSGLVVASGMATGKCSPCELIWVSHDGGHSFQSVAATGWDQRAPAIAVDAHGHEILFAASDHGLQRSDDDGATWAPIAGTGSGIAASVSPTYAQAPLVAVGSRPDYTMQGSGVRLVEGSGGRAGDLVFGFAPHYPSAAGHAPAFLSSLDGNSGLPLVFRCAGSLTCANPVSLPGATTYSNPVYFDVSPGYEADEVVFAQSQTGIYKSTDGGASFQPLQVGLAGATATATTGFALAPDYSQHEGARMAYASVLQFFGTGTSTKGHGGGGVFRTDDGGATWIHLATPGPFDGGSQALAVAPDGRVFASSAPSTTSGGDGGLLCSTDQGVTWQASCPAVGDAAQSQQRTGGSTVCRVSCGTASDLPITGGHQSGGGSPVGPTQAAGLGQSSSGLRRNGSGAKLAAAPSGAPLGRLLIVLGIVGVGTLGFFTVRHRRLASRGR